MIRMAVLYPQSDGSHFDVDYYTTKHMKLVRDRLQPLGMTDCGVDVGTETIGGGPAPFAVIGYVVFDTLDQFHAAMDEALDELVADVPNYTNIQPLIQVSEYTQT
jgi:uncharacterized protein (TIGR02118 family)